MMEMVEAMYQQSLGKEKLQDILKIVFMLV